CKNSDIKIVKKTKQNQNGNVNGQAAKIGHSVALIFEPAVRFINHTKSQRCAHRNRNTVESDQECQQRGKKVGKKHAATLYIEAVRLLVAEPNSGFYFSGSIIRLSMSRVLPKVAATEMRVFPLIVFTSFKSTLSVTAM